MEGASHGLADTTCFELYGFPNQAPPLSDSPTAAILVSICALCPSLNISSWHILRLITGYCPALRRRLATLQWLFRLLAKITSVRLLRCSS